MQSVNQSVSQSVGQSAVHSQSINQSRICTLLSGTASPLQRRNLQYMLAGTVRCPIIQEVRWQFIPYFCSPNEGGLFITT